MIRFATAAALSLALMGTAHAEKVSASIVANCLPQWGHLVVPAGQTAVNFQVTSLGAGTTCGPAPSAISQRGWGISQNGGQIYRSDMPLGGLTLSAGAYEVYVDGGQGAVVEVVYSLR